MARLSYTMRALYIAGGVAQHTSAMTCGDINTARGVLPRNAHSDERCNSPADPMNILFLNDAPASLERTFKQIKNNETGETWTNPLWLFLVTARDQRAQVGGSCETQNAQLVAGWFWDRFHVRIWGLGANVVAGAHHENLLTIGGNPPRPQGHKPDSFESGKVAICADFQALRKVVPNGLWLNNAKVTPYCSGYAAVIGLNI